MARSLLDEINARLASMSEADLIEPQMPIAPGDVVVGEMDDQHRRLFSLMFLYGNEAQRLADESSAAVMIGGDRIKGQFLLNKANTNKIKYHVVHDLLYSSLLVVHGLEDKLSLDIGVCVYIGWKVGYRTVGKPEHGCACGHDGQCDGHGGCGCGHDGDDDEDEPRD